MDQNLLNQYIFASLLDRQVQTAYRKRLESNPNDEPHLTSDDVKKAMVKLEFIRQESMNILKESGSKPSSFFDII